jgi:hypothetical protein
MYSRHAGRVHLSSRSCTLVMPFSHTRHAGRVHSHSTFRPERTLIVCKAKPAVELEAGTEGYQHKTTAGLLYELSNLQVHATDDMPLLSSRSQTCESLASYVSYM